MFIKLILLCWPILNVYADVLDVKSSTVMPIDQFVSEKISSGKVIILGESHAFAGQENLDQKNQVRLIKKLVQTYKNISVGMEFISYVYQDNLDSYLNLTLAENIFLNEISWGQNPFADYREQILEVRKGRGWAYGLNAPQQLTSYVGKNSIASLPNELLAFLPPHFELGRDVYKERFFNEMGFLSHHGANVDNYFQAQSIWDDTMAWRISEIMAKDPSTVLVVIVGQFHMQYGGGLQDRLKVRAPHLEVVTCLQSSAYKDFGLTELQSVLNSSKYGLVADYFY